MRKLTLTIGLAALALAVQGVKAADEPAPMSRGPTFEQTELDRTLPNIPERAVAPRREYGSPYEEIELGRALPQFPERMTPAPGMGASSGASMPAGDPWDTDHNFVAPAR